MKNIIYPLFRLVFFLFLVFYMLLELAVLFSLLDYLGQYIVEYNAEMYAWLMLGLALASLLFNHWFVITVRKISRVEWFYSLAILIFYIMHTVLFLLFGVWLFGDYKYDHEVYWGCTLINVTITGYHLLHKKRQAQEELP